MEYLHLLLDVAILLILLLFFLQGRKKGLILTLCGLVAVFVAFFGARMATEAFTPRVTEAIRPHIMPPCPTKSTPMSTSIWRACWPVSRTAH